MAKKVDKVEIVFTGKDQTKKATASANKNVESVEKTALAMTAALTVAAAASIAVITKAVSAYARQEQAILQLEQRIKSTGGAAGLTAGQLTSMAAGLQKVTTFGDEAVIEMQALLLTFTQIAGPQFERSTEAILNVAQAMGTDLKSAALQVGKALNDPIGQMSALTRSGIQFTDEQKSLIKTLVETNRVADAQNVILDELDTQFGGAARAAREGTGAIKAASNAVGDLWEAIGQRLSPTVVQLAIDVENLAVRFAEFISPSVQGKIRDEITLTVQRIDELRGELARTQSAEEGKGFFANLFYGGEGEADRIIGDINILEAELLSLEESLNGAKAAVSTDSGSGFTVPQDDISELQRAAQGLDATGGTEALDLQAQFDEQLALQQAANQEKFAEEILQAGRIDDLWLTSEEGKREAALLTNELKQQMRDADEMQADKDVERQKQRDQQKLNSALTLASATLSLMSALNSSGEKQSKKEFKRQKALNIAMATINTAQMAVAAGAQTEGGIYVKAAAVAAALIMGAAQISAIQSTTYSGGDTSGGGSLTSGGAGGFTDPTTTQAGLSTPVDQPQSGAAGGDQQTIILQNPGGLLGEWIENDFIPGWLEAQSRGVTTTLVTE